MSSVEFRTVMAIARRRSGKTAAEFDYSLAHGPVVDADGGYTGAAVAIDNAIAEVANESLGGTAEERHERTLALKARVKPELEALVAECAARSYTGWSAGSRGPIRYAR